MLNKSNNITRSGVAAKRVKSISDCQCPSRLLADVARKAEDATSTKSPTMLEANQDRVPEPCSSQTQTWPQKELFLKKTRETSMILVFNIFLYLFKWKASALMFVSTLQPS